MPSITTVAAAAVLLLSSVQAQDQYHIEPTSVPLYLRDNWCLQEQSSCPLICNQVPPGGAQTNECDPLTLTYGCVCNNGLAPNLSEYSLTLPYFKCQEWGNQCVTACRGNNACSSDCREKHPCGALDPRRANTTATTTSMASATSSGAAATSSAGQLFNGLDGDDSDSDSGSGSKPHNAASPLLQYGNVVGAITLAACVGLGSILL